MFLKIAPMVGLCGVLLLLLIILYSCNADSLLLWIEHVHKSADSSEMELFVALCWSIWGNRNKLVLENRGYDDMEVVRFVADYINHSEEAQPAYSSPRPLEPDHRWQPPGVGVVKVNFDASIYRDKIGAGILVAVLRDSNGVAWRRCKVRSICCPEIGFVARCAVQLAGDRQYLYAIFEGWCY